MPTSLVLYPTYEPNFVQRHCKQLLASSTVDIWCNWCSGPKYNCFTLLQHKHEYAVCIHAWKETQMHRPNFLFFLIITYMHTKTPHTCKHTKDIIIQTSSQWCYKQMKGQRRIMRVGKQSCTDSGVHLGGNTAFYSITHYFMKNLMRIGWSEGRREMPGWKRQQGKGWGDRESMRTEVSSFLCGWLCLTVFVHACVHFLTCIAGCLSALACKQKAWLIWTSYERYVLVCALLFVWA